MSIYIQEYNQGKITKNADRTYNYIVKDKKLGTFATVTDLVAKHPVQVPQSETQTIKTKKSSKKATSKE